MCRIGATFKKLSFGNNLDLKKYCYNIYNKRFDNFGDYEGYLLSYFLHPLYTGK